jgi:hydrogenase maturation protease
LSTLYEKSWEQQLSSLMDSNEVLKSISFVGVGNPIKSDDSVGLYMISRLRRELGAHPRKFVHIAPPTTSERTFSKLANRARKGSNSVVIFDSVEANAIPGTILFANINDTKYGFFATHNIPLRLIPAINSNSTNIFVLGIQPADTGIDERLSSVVNASANLIVTKVSECIRGLKE